MANKANKEAEPKAPEATEPVAEKAQPTSFGSTEFEAVRLSTKQLLDAQPKRTVRLKKNEDKNAPNYETVCINGHTFQIMRGFEVQVPQTVYDILDEAGLI